MPNGVNPHATPMQTPLPNMNSRNPLSTPGAPPTGGPGSSSGTASQPGSRPTPKPNKPKTSTPSLPAPPLDDVHAAFVEFRAKEEDKVSTCFSYDPRMRRKKVFNVWEFITVSVRAMHLLSAGPGQEYQQTAATLAGVSHLPERHEGLDSRE